MQRQPGSGIRSSAGFGNCKRWKQCKNETSHRALSMIPRKEKPETVADYIDAAPEDARRRLREMRACLRKAAPGATESLKWGVPALSYQRILFTFAAFKHHIGFYPTP